MALNDGTYQTFDVKRQVFVHDGVGVFHDVIREQEILTWRGVASDVMP